MKKQLIALAALAATSSAFAQSSVTLYGNLDASVGRKQTLNFVADPDTGDLTGIAKSGATKVDSSDLYESYFGLRGTEDLGGGLKAVFKLEAPIAVDSGAAVGGSSNYFSKNAFVGLAGDFGSVSLGRIESLFKLESAAFNPFGTSAVYSPSARLGLGKGQVVSLISDLDPTFALPSTDGSWSNTVAYASPNLSGLTFGAQYSAKESGKGSAADGTYNGGAYDLSVGYAAGPLAASLVYGEVRSTNATASAVKNKAWLLGASYDFGVVKAFGQYGQDKYTRRNETGSLKPKFFQLGVSAPVSASGTVLASFGQTRLSTDGLSSRTRDISLGYTHAVSKRTNAYAAILNEKARFAADGGSISKSIVNYSVGVRHAF